MSAPTSCGCGSSSCQKITLLFACSGAANVGEIADRAARRLMAEGAGAMFCLAGLGGDIEPMIDAARKADENIVIDGCDKDCGRKVMQRVGVANFRHVRVTDLGIEKVKGVWACDEQVQRIVDFVKAGTPALS